MDTLDTNSHIGNRQALGLWLNVTSLTVKAAGPDLSARQMAMLLTIYLEKGPHTVRALAKRLNVGKPAIVRAIDALAALGLLVRVPDPEDRRNVFIEGTDVGSVHLSRLAGDIARNVALLLPRQGVVEQRQVA